MRFSTVAAASAAAALVGSTSAIPLAGHAKDELTAPVRAPNLLASQIANAPLLRGATAKNLVKPKQGQRPLAAAGQQYKHAQAEYAKAVADLATARKLRTQAMGELGLGGLDKNLGAGQQQAEVGAGRAKRSIDMEGALEELAARGLLDEDDEIYARLSLKLPKLPKIPIPKLPVPSKPSVPIKPATPNKPKPKLPAAPGKPNPPVAPSKPNTRTTPNKPNAPAAPNKPKPSTNIPGKPNSPSAPGKPDPANPNKTKTPPKNKPKPSTNIPGEPNSPSAPGKPNPANPNKTNPSGTPKKPVPDPREEQRKRYRKGTHDLADAGRDYRKAQDEYKKAQADLAAARKLRNQALDGMGFEGIDKDFGKRWLAEDDEDLAAREFGEEDVLEAREFDVEDLMDIIARGYYENEEY